VEQACERIGGDEAYWQVYFQTLRYDFDEKLQRGLELYFRYAAELGLLKQEVALRFLEEQISLKVKE
jgi:chorismate dehydratase